MNTFLYDQVMIKLCIQSVFLDFETCFLLKDLSNIQRFIIEQGFRTFGEN